MSDSKGPRGVSRRLRAIAAALPATLFGLAVLLLVFGVGFLTAAYKLPPFQLAKNAEKTALTLRNELMDRPTHGFLGYTDIPAGEAVRRLIEPLQPQAGGEHVLFMGGPDQFLSLCPESGCIAVEMDRSGQVVHAYPYRPAAFSLAVPGAQRYETILFNFARDAYPVGAQKLPGGDLIVTFQFENAFPFGGGVARINPEGRVLWYRPDYSHHWPTLLPGGEVAVTTMRLGRGQLKVQLTKGSDFPVECGGPIEDDMIRILDVDGHVREEFSVLDAVLKSPYRAILHDTFDGCIPIHVNFVRPVPPDLPGLLPGVLPDDFVVSLRNVSAFIILGRHDHMVRRIFRGSFLHQHSVFPIVGGKTLLFDNWGGDWDGGPSRLVAYDFMSRSEHTLLSSRSVPGAKVFSETAGNIDVSPDGARALVASTWSGEGYEVSLKDGAVLTRFNNLSDLRSAPRFGDARVRSSGRFALYGLYYVR